MARTTTDFTTLAQQRRLAQEQMDRQAVASGMVDKNSSLYRHAKLSGWDMPIGGMNNRSPDDAPTFQKSGGGKGVSTFTANMETGFSHGVDSNGNEYGNDPYAADMAAQQKSLADYSALEAKSRQKHAQDTLNVQNATGVLVKKAMSGNNSISPEGIQWFNNQFGGDGKTSGLLDGGRTVDGGFRMRFANGADPMGNPIVQEMKIGALDIWEIMNNKRGIFDDADRESFRGELRNKWKYTNDKLDSYIPNEVKAAMAKSAQEKMEDQIKANQQAQEKTMGYYSDQRKYYMGLLKDNPDNDYAREMAEKYDYMIQAQIAAAVMGNEEGAEKYLKAIGARASGTLPKPKPKEEEKSAEVEKELPNPKFGEELISEDEEATINHVFSKDEKIKKLQDVIADEDIYEDEIAQEDGYIDEVAKEGEIYKLPKKDEEGNDILDENGQPVLEEKSFKPGEKTGRKIQIFKGEKTGNKVLKVRKGRPTGRKTVHFTDNKETFELGPGETWWGKNRYYRMTEDGQVFRGDIRKRTDAPQQDYQGLIFTTKTGEKLYIEKGKRIRTGGIVYECQGDEMNFNLVPVHDGKGPNLTVAQARARMKEHEDYWENKRLDDKAKKNEESKSRYPFGSGGGYM